MKAAKILSVVFMSTFLVALIVILISTTILSTASMLEARTNKKTIGSTSGNSQIVQKNKSVESKETLPNAQVKKSTAVNKSSRMRNNSEREINSDTKSTKNISSKIDMEKKSKEDIIKFLDTYIPLIYNMDYRTIENDIDRINRYHTAESLYVSPGEDKDAVITYYKNNSIEEKYISYKINSIKFIDGTSNGEKYKKALANTTTNYLENGEKKIEKIEFTIVYDDASKSYKIAGIK